MTPPASEDAAPAAILRPAGPRDAEELSVLLSELGYPSAPEAVVRRISACADVPGLSIVVATMDERIVGVVAVHCVPTLISDAALGRITALVVADEMRGRGIGRQLVEEAEAFARKQGCERMELTSGDHRPGAHAFYVRLGYAVEARRFIKHGLGER
ncbi:GNAT family N-acetyltransferase [Luteolibacter soli]|uniref:GNAT family N-acetyltransferase n=1 Tax=Luteolibacter soli TaxID=3135280 RepID=A0ABU9B256_9BACT